MLPPKTATIQMTFSAKPKAVVKNAHDFGSLFNILRRKISDLSQTTKLSSIRMVLLPEKLSIRRCNPASIGVLGPHFSQFTASVNLTIRSTV